MLPTVPGRGSAETVAKVAIVQRLDRIKIFLADDCQSAFKDTSRSLSRQWCRMKLDITRANADAFVNAEHASEPARSEGVHAAAASAATSLAHATPADVGVRRRA